MTVHLILGDCLPAMREMPDAAFDLAIVDPPYGGGCNAAFGGRFERYQVWTDRRNVGGEVPATREREIRGAATVAVRGSL